MDFVVPTPMRTRVYGCTISSHQDISPLAFIASQIELVRLDNYVRRIEAPTIVAKVRNLESNGISHRNQHERDNEFLHGEFGSAQ